MKTKPKKKAILKAILPLLLSAALIVEPAADVFVSYAAEPETGQETAWEDGTAGISVDEGSQEEAVDIEPDAADGFDDADGDDEAVNSDETDNPEGDAGDNGSDNPDGGDDGIDTPADGGQDAEATDNAGGGNSDDVDSDTTDSAEDNAAADTDAESDNVYEMPADYVLSPEQKEDKAALAASLTTFDKDSEGVSYVEREIFALVDTYEEAELIADGYNAELLRFDLGVATFRLSEGDIVADALFAAADLGNNLPAVYPNYYVYMSSEPQPTEDVDDSRLEIEEDVYDAESGEILTSPDEDSLESSESYEHAVSAYAEPYMQPNSGYYQWQHVNVGSVYAWNAGYKGQGVKVAVLDTGGTAAAGELEYAARYNVASGSSSPNDSQGHGSHVAGIVGARLNNTGGAGIAPSAQLYSIKVLGDDGSGEEADIIRGIYKAIECGVDLINMSLGGVGYNPATQKAADAAYEAGIAIFAAAGNDGGQNMSYPAGYKHVICVAASDSNNQRAYFSNYGSWVDISAPGLNIYSTSNAGTGTYVSKSGTSMACPAAVGEAAVLLSAKPASVEGKTGGKKVDALKKLMQSNTVSAGSGMGKGVTSLTKALKLSVAASKPNAPVITATVSEDAQRVTVTIAKESGMTVYYTTDGKAVSYKDGKVSDGAKTYSAAFSVNNVTKGTIQAIAVNASGVSSPVKKVTFSLKPLVSMINISGVSRIAKGKSVTLSAEVLPSYATNKKLTWKLTKADGTEPAAADGVSVSQSGKVTVARTAAAGGYTVTATAKDTSGKAGVYAITVIDSPDIKSVKFKNTKLELWSDEGAYGMTSILEAEKEGGSVVSAADFKWSSSKSDVAVVSAAGVVTPKANGTATITALANDSSGKKATCTITVKRHAGAISITGGNKVAKGSKITLKAEVTPDNTSNKKVNWTISKAGGGAVERSDGVSVNGSGAVSATSSAVVGEYTVTATAADGSGKSASKKITVVEGKITSITLNKKSASIYRVTNQYGAPTSVTLTATLQGAGDYAQDAYSCTNSNPGIATVSTSRSGDIITVTVTATGKAVGKTKVTIETTDGSNKKAVCTVSVTNPASKINITSAAGSTCYVAQGKSLKLNAGLESEFGAIANKKIKWSISGADASSPVKINGSGKISVDRKASVGSKYYALAELPDNGGLASYQIEITQSGGTVRLRNGFLTMSPLVKWKATKGGVYGLAISSSKTTVKGGFSVTSSNPKVASTMINNGYVVIAFDSKGSTTVTVKANDGSGMQVKYNFVCK